MSVGIKLTWEYPALPAVPITGFTIHRRTPSTGHALLTTLTDPDIRQYVDTDQGLSVGQTYIYRVSAVGTNGGSTSQTTDTQIVLTVPPPAAPTNVQAVAVIV